MECSYDFVIVFIFIIKYVYFGVELKSLVGSSSVCVIGLFFSEIIILIIVEMGFFRFRVEVVLRQVGLNSVELVMEWLFFYLEEI